MTILNIINRFGEIKIKVDDHQSSTFRARKIEQNPQESQIQSLKLKILCVQLHILMFLSLQHEFDYGWSTKVMFLNFDNLY